MEWLNYHHLLYFWMVAKEGGLRPASEKLHVSQPSISAQISDLESALGEKLFQRSGRKRELTEAGQLVFQYADEIFALGRELMNTIKRRPGTRHISLYVGVADSFPKLVTSEILKPAFKMPQTVHVVCREGKIEHLLAQLNTHKLDLVLADEPASSAQRGKIFNHLLGESGISFCAEPSLARKLKRGFPESLNTAPALFPAEDTAPRRALEQWLHKMHLHPHVVAEFDDAALMRVMAAEGQGFIPLPSVVVEEAATRYKFQLIGSIDAVKYQFYAITAERRITNPAVMAIIENAQKMLGAPLKTGPA
jgi:LysR family transcriptional activator of nhaA